jgi:hypothetical protein
MKITRRQLRQIIKEAFSGYADERPRNPMERAYAKRETEVDLDLSKIKNANVEGIDMTDRPDFVDAFVDSAEYEYSPGKFRDLSDDEINYLNDNEHDWIHTQVWEQVN